MEYESTEAKANEASVHHLTSEFPEGRDAVSVAES